MDQSLIDTAATVLGVDALVPFPRSGQKFVARGARGRESVVLKVVELSGAHREVTLERARREVELLARIDHPNVVRVLTKLVEIGEPAVGVAWLEECLEGEDLVSLLGPEWTWDDVAQMARNVASGLGAMHKAKAVHRDLSAGNVRQVSRGHYVIMDPGLARHIEQSTLTGLFQPGTPGFMTPEHAAMTRPTPASDVFAVGILMYCALTGQLPIPVSADFDEYRLRLRDTQAASVSLLRPDLTANQVAIVDRCLQRQSARRPLDGTELADELERL